MAGRKKTKSIHPLDGDSIKEFTRVLRLMSNPTRLRILLVLGRKECSVGELCGLLGVSQPAASHHLGLLRMSGLVRDRRQGKQVFYSLDRGAWDNVGRRFGGPGRNS
ncbi:MAG: metalloregulator ArsR/SmtB family transcription factor [Candidatus Methylomirabilis sp.]|nr:metalloregulator ArsR/SmtB family transcription factor [Deltaproteobacteria bacterium]